MKTYTEELVFAESTDGILQEGVVIRPASSENACPIPVIWTHGYTSRFSEPVVVKVGRELASRGVTFIGANNRGNNFAAWCNTQGRGQKLGGAGWELFSESVHDVAGWVGFAVGLGFPGVALLGHSYGGLKVGYYLGTRDDPRVRGLVVASAPLWGRRWRLNPKWAAAAERLVADGRRTELLPWDNLPTDSISAEAYLDQSRTNIDIYGSETPDAPISRVSCPIFAFYGTEEGQVGTAADLEIIRRNAVRSSRVETRMFAGATHSYAGHEGEVAEAIAAFVRGLA